VDLAFGFFERGVSIAAAFRPTTWLDVYVNVM
jgi:hypothetical protein